MKKVTLLGDSIRMGYLGSATRELAGWAEVRSPEGNCMHSVHHLLNLAWYLEWPADLIHFNFGLWDCRRLGPDRPENAVPVEIFARNLDYILEKTRANSQATLIWATITPVVQDRYNARFTKTWDPCRAATDVPLYNAAAAPILAKHNVIVNDLYSFVEERGREKMINEDGVHYSDEAYVLLGKKVGQCIKQFL